MTRDYRLRLMIKARILIRRGIELELHRYTLASLANTAAGTAVILILYKITTSPAATLITSAIAGYIYSIISYHRLAFRGKRKNPPFLRYGLVYGSGLAINGTVTWIVVSLTGSFFQAQLVAVPIVICLQWVASRYWAFRSDPQFDMTRVR